MPESFGDASGEHSELRSGVGVVVDEHEILWVSGPDARSFLDSILSQELVSQPVGHVVRSLLLSPQGKMGAAMWVLVGDNRIGLIVDSGVGASALASLTRYRFRVDVTLSGPEPVVELWGPGAGAVLESAGLIPTVAFTDGDLSVARADLAGLPRFFLAGIDADTLVANGGRRCGSIAATAVRIVAGEPKMGTDLDERTIPQESGLVADSVSFTKGCYLGQELVARIDSRGHVNRHLRGIVMANDDLPPSGAELRSGDKTVGVLTSVAQPMGVRGPIALALVRREVEPGSQVEVTWDGGSTQALVAALPLEDFDQTG